MKYSSSLEKEIPEAAYLTAENAYRYRPIMRFFYQKYEQAENWLYKEDVYEALKEHIEYSMEECQRDLEFLVSKKSLITMQDTENANTLEKFKFKNFRYQLTDYAVEIEKMTIYLEEMEVKVTSLETRLFERIRNLLKKIAKLNELKESECYELWIDLTTDFTNLNQSYQEFLKKFSEPQTEELLQSVLFIEFKQDLIRYLENFIKEYLRYSKEISDIIKEMKEEEIKKFMENIISYLEKTPKIKPEFDFEHLKEVNYGKWLSIKKWFYKEGGVSEGDRLLKSTNNIISKVTKYASNLIELHGNMIQRKEEYKHMIKLFDNLNTIEDANLLSSTIFGVGTIKHYKGVSNLISDSLISSYDVPPIEIEIDPMKRGIRTIKNRTPIKDKSKEKEEILAKFHEEEEKKKQVLEQFMKQKKWHFEGKINLTKEERRYIFSLVDKLNRIEKNIGEGIDPIFGLKYKITFENNTSCQIESEDGTLIMEGLQLEFVGEENE